MKFQMHDIVDPNRTKVCIKDTIVVCDSCLAEIQLSSMRMSRIVDLNPVSSPFHEEIEYIFEFNSVCKNCLNALNIKLRIWTKYDDIINNQTVELNKCFIENHYLAYTKEGSND